MDTTIGYLLEVREDLLETAWRAEGGNRRYRSRRTAWSGRRILAASSAVFVLAAGVTGWLVTRNGSPLTQAIKSGPSASPAPQAGNASATGQVGFDPGVTQQDHLGSLGGGAPAVQPAEGLAEIPGGLPNLSKVIKTANMSVVVPTGSFEERFAEASQVTGAVGGYVQTSTTRDRSGTLTMRVPADRFDDALAQLRVLGHVESRTIQGKDVTSDYIDLRARLRIAKARRLVLLQLMQKAHSIEQTIKVQNALDDTQHQIEDLQGSLNVLDNRTSFATIRLELREQGVQIQNRVMNPSIPNAWDRAIAGFIGVIVGVIVGLGYVVPIAVLFGLAWLVVARVRRRRLA